jgi:hypothetical protein
MGSKAAGETGSPIPGGQYFATRDPGGKSPTLSLSSVVLTIL